MIWTDIIWSLLLFFVATCVMGGKHGYTNHRSQFHVPQSWKDRYLK